MLPLLRPSVLGQSCTLGMVVRCSVYAALRLQSTLSSQSAGPLAAALVAPTPATASSRQPESVEGPKEQPSNHKVLGVLTTLLQQQQHDAQSLQQQQAAGQQAASTMQWPSTGSQALPEATCQPYLSAASSGQVRMESQLVFDSCWRRFREKHGMVSCLACAMLGLVSVQSTFYSLSFFQLALKGISGFLKPCMRAVCLCRPSLLPGRLSG
jgi:hypothetical protein